VPPAASTVEAPQTSAVLEAVADEAHRRLTSIPKTLAPWLFYDEAGSRLFEQITTLPEYYLTRTERSIFTAHADEIVHLVSSSTDNLQPATRNSLTIAELGAGTASKTGILLRALTCAQRSVLYQPIDISPSALDEARSSIESSISGVMVRPQVANYVTQSVRIERPVGARILALYIGSSIGNFSPGEARSILRRLRSELSPGDALLLGTDLAPHGSGKGPGKSVATLLAAYDDAAGITAAFNRNVLVRLNRELGADFQLDRFAHRAVWNAAHSRIEMHLESLGQQIVNIPATAGTRAANIHFAAGETIHTENSYKFTPSAIKSLLAETAFSTTRTFTDSDNRFAVTLAAAI
jgi:L-histidine N-alpha-methyltransferase